uniref:Muscarinic toxin 38 n=1 Tax=Ophiophagus hannah TaxID=8665 RepID=3SIM8_OPHHA|nr:RecName: Full=Muscarinic toxin 38; Short=MTX38; Flags: Precursor [Ophiophagus hannah]ABB83639.1 muscarinic toxin precursor [Ophiophagus hannah]
MKTLLLTLVVVTIVCLDLGYTMTCYTQYSLSPPTTKTCPDGQNLCYKRWFAFIPHGNKFFRGCAAACPKAEHNEVVRCCARDKCNL